MVNILEVFSEEDILRTIFGWYDSSRIRHVQYRKMYMKEKGIKIKKGHERYLDYDGISIGIKLLFSHLDISIRYVDGEMKEVNVPSLNGRSIDLSIVQNNDQLRSGYIKSSEEIVVYGRLNIPCGYNISKANKDMTDEELKIVFTYGSFDVYGAMKLNSQEYKDMITNDDLVEVGLPSDMLAPQMLIVDIHNMKNKDVENPEEGLNLRPLFLSLVQQERRLNLIPTGFQVMLYRDGVEDVSDVVETEPLKNAKTRLSQVLLNKCSSQVVYDINTAKDDMIGDTIVENETMITNIKHEQNIDGVWEFYVELDKLSIPLKYVRNDLQDIHKLQVGDYIAYNKLTSTIIFDRSIISDREYNTNFTIDSCEACGSLLVTGNRCSNTSCEGITETHIKKFLYLYVEGDTEKRTFLRIAKNGEYDKIKSFIDRYSENNWSDNTMMYFIPGFTPILSFYDDVIQIFIELKDSINSVKHEDWINYTKKSKIEYILTQLKRITPDRDIDIRTEYILHRFEYVLIEILSNNSTYILPELLL